MVLLEWYNLDHNRISTTPNHNGTRHVAHWGTLVEVRIHGLAALFILISLGSPPKCIGCMVYGLFDVPRPKILKKWGSNLVQVYLDQFCCTLIHYVAPIDSLLLNLFKYLEKKTYKLKLSRIQLKLTKTK